MNWCNFCFLTAGREVKIENLETDFENGIKLIQLVEVLTGEQLEKYNEKPRLRIQKANNINIALKKIKDEGVNVTCGAEGTKLTRGNCASSTISSDPHRYCRRQPQAHPRSGLAVDQPLPD